MLRENVLLGKLRNGLIYYIYKNNTTDKIRFLLLSKTGSLNDEINKNGLAHLNEHMCLSPDLSFLKEVNEKYSNSPYTIKYSFSGYTDFDRTILRIYRRSEKGNLDNDFYIIKNIINGEAFREDALDKVKGDIIYECKYYENKNELQKKIINFITDGTVKDLPMGTPELIQKITMDDLTKFHNKNYTYEKSALLIIGNEDVNELERMIIKTFNSQKSVSKPVNMVKKTLQPYSKNEVLVLNDKEKDHNVIKVYYRFLFDNSTLKKRLIRYFFDRMLENYIKGEFELKDIDLIDIGCTDKRNINTMDYFIVIYKTNNSIETKDVYINTINNLIQNKFNENQLNEQVIYLKDILKEISSSEDEIATEELSDEFIKNFFDNEAVILIKDNYNEILTIIDEIKLSDINDILIDILSGYCKIVEIKMGSVKNFV